MNKIKKNSILIFFITIVIVIWILKDNFNDIINNLLSANSFIFLIVILLYIIYFLLDQRGLYLITKEYDKNIKYSYICNLGIVTKFFNGVTPLATGGQPLQVYYFNKHGIKPTMGTNIIIQNYIVFQIALIIITILSLILNNIYNVISNSIFFRLTIIGFLINLFILLFLLLIGFNKSFAKIIVHFFINVLNKLKLIKSKNKTIKKWDEICENFNYNAKLLLANKKTFIKCILLQILSQTIYYSLPFFVALSLNSLFNLSLLDATICGCLIYVMSCYVPIPGATGGMEYGFLSSIGIFIKKPELYAVLLIWRFITYYLPTIVGAIVFNFFVDDKGKEIAKNG